jgi:hypothetical protein
VLGRECDTGICVIEQPGLIAVLVSGTVTGEMFKRAYAATLPELADTGVDAPEGESRRRVAALKKTLGDLHASGGAFSVVAFDAIAGRVLAARTANSARVDYGFTQDGSLVACSGFTSATLFPNAGDAALQLTPLPSGRFIFGHRFVKPIEFTNFWASASANRAAAPARGVGEVNDESLDCGAAECQRRRWGKTGSAGDASERWGTLPKVVTDIAATTSTGRTTAQKFPLHAAGANAYVPPSVRKARAEAEAAAAATAVATQKPKEVATQKPEEEVTETQESSEPAPESPRTALRKVESDAQIAKAFLATDFVSSLGEALISAVAKAPPALRRASLDLHRTSLRRASLDIMRTTSLRSNTFTVSRVPGMETNNEHPTSCAEAHVGFASFKANFARMSSAVHH